MNITEYYFERSTIIIDFMITKYKDEPIFSEIKTNILTAYSSNNLKGLKLLTQDMNTWAKSLQPNHILELEILLFEKLGEDLSGDKITLKTVKRIITKGRIENEEEYTIIYNYLQEITLWDKLYKKIAVMESLIAAYIGINEKL